MRAGIRRGVHSLHGVLVPLNAPEHDQLRPALHQGVEDGLLGGAGEGRVLGRQPCGCARGDCLAEVQNVDHHGVAGEAVHAAGAAAVVVGPVVAVVAVAGPEAVLVLAEHVQLPLAVVHSIGADGRETRSQGLRPSPLHVRVGVGAGTGAAVDRWKVRGSGAR